MHCGIRIWNINGQNIRLSAQMPESGNYDLQIMKNPVILGIRLIYLFNGFAFNGFTFMKIQGCQDSSLYFWQTRQMATGRPAITNP